MKITHRGFDDFIKGSFCGSDNLFVDANGVLRRIMDNDVNHDGKFDIVLPNSHGYIERGPTEIYKQNEQGEYVMHTRLPHDSCWQSQIVDVDGDGYVDLVIANGENGVTSELNSFIYWGGPNGLTGECTVLPTIGGYSFAVLDLNGDGKKDLIFSNAWFDHHNPGRPYNQRVYIQGENRTFTVKSEDYGLIGYGCTAILCEDLNGDGYPDMVCGNLRIEYEREVDTFIYWGTPNGFDTENPTKLPGSFTQGVNAYDLNGDGYKELILTGNGQMRIFWNDKGNYAADNMTRLDIPGISTMFCSGILTNIVADVDGDGVNELIIGTAAGVDIRKLDNLQETWQLIPCEGCSWVAAGDLNGNGQMDIVATRYCTAKSYDETSYIFWNDNGKFSFENRTELETHGPMGVTIGDLDGDGKNEIIFCNTMAGPGQFDPEFPVFMYYGGADNKYPKERKVDYPVNVTCHSYALADVDNDGFVELICTNCDGARIFKGTPNGPDPKNYYDVHQSHALTGGTLIGDFNHDGWLDLIVTCWVYDDKPETLANGTTIFWGGPNGFSDDNKTALPAYTQCSQAVTMADINGDGYLDFIYGDGRDYIGIFYGTKDGFDFSHHDKVYLKEPSGALPLGLTTADINGDGKLELMVATAGHYRRLRGDIYVMFDGENGFPEEKQVRFETGGTAGFPALADLDHSGTLSLLLPFYSTTESRVLPARIFKNDGKGNFDWENPQEIECMASINFLPADVTGNGYPDLFIACHRNDLGHIVDSKLIYNGPDGLDFDNVQNFEGYGPHGFTSKNQGNAFDRSENEYYESAAIELSGKPTTFSFEAETPFRTKISFALRFASTEEGLKDAAWQGCITESGAAVDAPADAKYMQYRATLCAPGLVNSPRLTSVSIDCE